MLKSTLLSTLSFLLLPTTILAKCNNHSFTSCADNIVHWFDPDTGEICDPLDCGGGRAPVKYDVPGCAAYTGTKVPKTSPSYLPCWTPSASASASASSTAHTQVPPVHLVGSTTSMNEVATETGAAAASSATQVSGGSMTTTTLLTTPSTTLPPSLLTSSQTGSGIGGQSTSSTASVTTPTSNAGSFIDGSVMARAGAVIGAIALI